MSETIRVVRVEINETVENEHGDFYLVTVQSNHFASVQIPVPLDGVIELTEERSNFPGGNTQGRRWVSRRESVDE